MTTTIQTLEAGKLYQVKHWEKGWIIAEYVKMIPAHSYKYNELHIMTFKTGPEKIRNVPDCHLWKKIRPKEYNSTFQIEDRKLETREVTQDAIDMITQLRAEIVKLGEEQKQKIKELREFCE